jgi:hypothetical protein
MAPQLHELLIDRDDLPVELGHLDRLVLRVTEERLHERRESQCLAPEPVVLGLDLGQSRGGPIEPLERVADRGVGSRTTIADR